MITKIVVDINLHLGHYLIGKKSVGKKFRRQKISSVINIRHLDKNSSLFTDEIF